MATKPALEAAAKVMNDGGIEISLPWEGDLDDLERHRYDTFHKALDAAAVGKVVPETDRWMPIQLGMHLELRVRRKEAVVVVQRIPWVMIADQAGERRARVNHDQSLAKLAERGGISAAEAVCIISGIEWQSFGAGEENAHRILYAMLVLFNRGKLVARGDI